MNILKLIILFFLIILIIIILNKKNINEKLTNQDTVDEFTLDAQINNFINIFNKYIKIKILSEYTLNNTDIYMYLPNKLNKNDQNIKWLELQNFINNGFVATSGNTLETLIFNGKTSYALTKKIII
jgi:hypothetical protein